MSDESGLGLLSETPGSRQQAVRTDAQDIFREVESRPQRGRGDHCFS